MWCAAVFLVAKCSCHSKNVRLYLKADPQGAETLWHYSSSHSSRLRHKAQVQHVVKKVSGMLSLLGGITEYKSRELQLYNH